MSGARNRAIVKDCYGQPVASGIGRPLRAWSGRDGQIHELPGRFILADETMVAGEGTCNNIERIVGLPPGTYLFDSQPILFDLVGILDADGDIAFHATDVANIHAAIESLLPLISGRRV
jgi:hypothetical protein